MTSRPRYTMTYFMVSFSIGVLIFLSSLPKKVNASVVKKIHVNSSQNQIRPFEMKIISADYSNAFNISYVLTQNELKIIFRGELKGEKDKVIFQKYLRPNQSLIKLAAIKLDALNAYYTNPCVRDGSQIIVQIKKDNMKRQVQLSNFYHPTIGIAIELINTLVPKKYAIWYDKKSLIEEMSNCQSVK